MPRYVVSAEATIPYGLVVEAPDGDAAAQRAETYLAALFDREALRTAEMVTSCEQLDDPYVSVVAIQRTAARDVARHSGLTLAWSAEAARRP
jgi:hypothetical protein